MKPFTLQPGSEHELTDYARQLGRESRERHQQAPAHRNRVLDMTVRFIDQGFDLKAARAMAEDADDFQFDHDRGDSTS